MATCYYPDGETSRDVPCQPDRDASSCCASGSACLGTAAQYYICEKNGNFARGSCTDPSWKSTACPRACVDPDRNKMYSGNNVISCPGTSKLFYCVGEGLGPDNCSTGFDIVAFDSHPTVLTVVAASSTSTSSPSTIVGSFSSTGSTGLSTGAKIGIGVGVPVGALAVACLAFWFGRRKGLTESRRLDDYGGVKDEAETPIQVPAHPAPLQPLQPSQPSQPSQPLQLVQPLQPLQPLQHSIQLPAEQPPVQLPLESEAMFSELPGGQTSS